MSENMRVSDVSKVTSIAFGIDGLCIFFASIWFKYISPEWQKLYGIPLLLMCMILVWLILQYDTPTYNYTIRKYDKVRQLLTYIGRTNGVLGPSEEYTKVF